MSWFRLSLDTLKEWEIRSNLNENVRRSKKNNIIYNNKTWIVLYYILFMFWIGGNRLTVIKRDGRKVKFDKEKIKIAVLKAFIDVVVEKNIYFTGEELG